MSRYVDLGERVTAQFYDQEHEEWTMQTVTIKDVLDSVCDEYTVLPSAQPEQQWIPATERLPENDGMYYVTITRMGGIDAVPCIWYDKKWAIGGAKVIAWLAIPEPYRAERREEE